MLVLGWRRFPGRTRAVRAQPGRGLRPLFLEIGSAGLDGLLDVGGTAPQNGTTGIYDEATGNSYAPEGWYEEHDSDNPIMSLQADPTHWMPLPPAPPAAGEETR